MTIRKQTLCFLCGLGLLLASVPALADETDSDESVRVYTNADLERLSPLPQQQERVAPPMAGEDWDLLVRLIEMENQKNREARAEQLERERFAIAHQAWKDAMDYAEYNGYVGYPYGGYGYGFAGGGIGVGSGFFTTTIQPNPDYSLMSRLRVPMGQRGVFSANDAFKEMRKESALRFNQPPLGRRPNK